MVWEVANWVTNPAAWDDSPLAISPFSSRTTSVLPSLARCQATCAPTMPPPTITISAFVFMTGDRTIRLYRPAPAWIIGAVVSPDPTLPGPIRDLVTRQPAGHTLLGGFYNDPTVYRED